MKRLVSAAVALVALLGAVQAHGDLDMGEETVSVEALFAYGTLLDPKVQRRVIGRTVEGRPDTLPRYRKGVLQLPGAAYFIAIPDEQGEIDGGVLEVTPMELRRIDRYEGEAYERARVTLRSGTEAWVYRRPANGG